MSVVGVGGLGAATFDFEALSRSLVSGQGVSQIILLAAAGALAWLFARSLRARLPENIHPGFAKIGAGGASRIAFPLLFLILAWLSRLALAKLYPVPLLNLAIPLIASFAAIRLAVYLLRHLFPPSVLLKSLERFISFTAWAFVALYLTGMLSEILSALEAITFHVGKDKKNDVSLRQVIEGFVYAVFTVFVALGLAGVVEKRVMAAATVDMSLRVVISKTLRALALVFGVLGALSFVGIDLTMLSVFGGALGVGLGLGLQKIASNYVSGFIILLDRSVQLGDLVTVDSRHGVVDAIRARYTIIKGFDGTKAIIPNDTLITNVVTNHAYADRVFAVKSVVTISYESNLDTAVKIWTTTAKSHPRVMAAPEPLVLVTRLGENGIELELLAWISDQDLGQATVRSDLLQIILREFHNANVVVASQQRNVYVAERNVNNAGVDDAATGLAGENTATHKK